VFRRFTVVFRRFTAVFRRFTAVFRRFTIVFRRFTLVFRRFTLVFRRFTLVFRRFTLVFRRFTLVFRRFTPGVSAWGWCVQGTLPSRRLAGRRPRRPLGTQARDACEPAGGTPAFRSRASDQDQAPSTLDLHLPAIVIALPRRPAISAWCILRTDLSAWYRDVRSGGLGTTRV
jgi:hypothetical protein